MRSSDVAEGIDLSGRRVVVTGASSGLGLETARMLAAIGAEATIAVGNTEADRQVAAVITAAIGTDRLRVAHLDLDERASIARFAEIGRAAGHPRQQRRRHPPDYRPCADVRAYGQSKIANVTFAVGASDRWVLDDITVNAAMPGPAHTTFQRKMDPGGYAAGWAASSGGMQLGEDEVPRGMGDGLVSQADAHTGTVSQ